MKINGNQQILKEAIAEAKTIRETAIANAKIALEEAFTPRIQSMVSAKLQEMELDETELEELSYETNENMEEEEHNPISEEELDALLAELDSETISEEEEELFENEDLVTEKKKKEEKDDKPKDKKDSKDENKDKDKDKDDEIDLKNLTVTELKDIIASVVHEVIEDQGPAVEDEFSDETDINVDMPGNEIPGMDDTDDEMSLDEILAEIEALEEENILQERKAKKEVKKDDSKEIIKEIAKLKNELNEVNLLNSKLMYTTRLFKDNNFSETQKMKILEQFDKVNTPKEAKLIYETMENSFQTRNDKSRKFIKESFSIASKPAGVARERIIETDAVVSRFQKLAGLNQ